MGTSLGELYFALGLDSKKFDDAIKEAKKKIADMGADVDINVNLKIENIGEQVQKELAKLQSHGEAKTIKIDIELTNLKSLEAEIKSTEERIQKGLSLKSVNPEDIKRFEDYLNMLKSQKKLEKEIGNDLINVQDRAGLQYGVKLGDNIIAGLRERLLKGERPSELIVKQGGEGVKPLKLDVQINPESLTNVKEQLEKLKTPITTKIQIEYDTEKFQAVETAMKNFGKRINEAVNGGMSGGKQNNVATQTQGKKKGWLDRVSDYLMGDESETSPSNIQDTIGNLDNLNESLNEFGARLAKLNEEQERRMKNSKKRSTSTTEEDNTKRELAQLRRLEEGVRRWENVRAGIESAKVDKDSEDYRKAIALIDAYIDKLKEAQASAGKFTDREMTEMLGQTLSGKVQEANRLVKAQKDVEKTALADFAKQQAQIQRFEESIRRIQNVKAKINASGIDKESEGYKRATAILDDYIDKLETSKSKAGNFTRREMAGITGQTLSGEIAEAERLIQAEKNLARQKEQASKNAIKQEKDEIDLKKKRLQLEREEQNLSKAASNAKKAELQKDKEAIRLKKERVSLQKKLKNGTKDASNWASQLNDQFNNLISIYSIERFIRSLYTIGGEFQKQHIALQNMIGDADKAGAIFERMKDMSVKSPFTFSELASYTKQMSAYGIEYEELYDTTKRLADISAGVGVDMGRLILAYGQVRSAAVLRGQELRQFTEAGIPLVAELANKFSELENRIVTTGEVFDKISKREVSFDMVKDILFDMTDPGGRFFETQERLAESLAGKWANLKDAWDIMIAGIAEDTNSVLGDLAEMLTNLTRSWQTLTPIIVGLIGVLGSYRAVVTGVSYAQAALAATINPWIAVVAAIAGVSAGFYLFNSTLDSTESKLKKVNVEMEKSIQIGKDNATNGKRYLDILSETTKNEAERPLLIARQEEAFRRLNELYPELLKNISLEKASLEDINALKSKIDERERVNEIQALNERYVKAQKEADAAKRLYEHFDKKNKEYKSGESWFNPLGIDDEMVSEELSNWERLAKIAKQYKKEWLDALDSKKVDAPKNDRSPWMLKADEVIAQYSGISIRKASNESIYNYFNYLEEVFKEAKDKYERTTSESLRKPEKAIMDAVNAVNMAIGGVSFYELNKKGGKTKAEQAAKLDANAYVEALKQKLAEEAQKWDLYKQLFEATGNKKLSMSIAFTDSMSFVSPYLESLKKQLEDKAKELGVKMSLGDLLKSGEKQLMADKSIPEKDREKVAKSLGAIIDAYHKENKRLKTETIKDYVSIINASKDFAARIDDIERDLQKNLETLRSIHGAGTPEYERAANEAIRKAEEEKTNVRFEEFKKSSDWVKVFDDMDRVSNATLDSMIVKIEEFAKQANLSEEVTKQLVDAMAKLRDEAIERNPFEGFKDAWGRLKYYKSLSGKVGEYDENGKLITQQMIDDGIAEANEDLKNSSLAVAEKFQAVADASDLLAGLFENMGVNMDGFLGIISGVLGGAASGAQTGAGIASALGMAGPWGAVAGAAVGMLSSVFAMHDKALQKEIEASEAREKLIKNVADNLEKQLSYTMGGLYSSSLSSEMLALLRDWKETTAMESVQQLLGKKAVYGADTKQKASEALRESSYYDAQMAALMAERDELMHQRKLEEDKKKADKNKIADYNQEIEEMEASIRHFAEDMANELYGIDFKGWASQLAESLVDAWASGEDAVEAYKNTIDDILRDVGVSVISQKILEPLLEETMNEFLAQFEKDNGKLTDDSMKILAGMYEEADEAANATEAYLEGLKKLGIDVAGTSSDSASGLSKGIQSVTEDTADLLASYLNAIRGDVSVKRSLIEKLIVEDVPKMNYLAEAQLQQLQMIVTNTKRNADVATEIRDLFNRVVDKGSNKLKV